MKYNVEMNDIQIKQTRGYWEVYIDGVFFCSADNYIEAINELYEFNNKMNKEE